MSETQREPESAFFRRMAEFVLANRIKVVLATLVLTGGLMAKMPPKTDFTVESFLDGEGLATLEMFRSIFGRDDTFVVLVEGDVFSMDYVERLKKLHDELGALDIELDSIGETRADRQKLLAGERVEAKTIAGAEEFGDFDESGLSAESTGADFSKGEGGTIVDEIISLINARQTRGSKVHCPGADTDFDEPECDGIEVGELMDPMPTAEQLPALKERALADQTLLGRIVDPTGRYSAVVIRTQRMSEPDSAKVVQVIAGIAKKYETPFFRTHIAGLPALAAALNEMFLSEMALLFLLSFIVLILLMFFLFRHPLGVIGPMVVVALAIMWTFGAMALIGWPMTMITNIMPVFIICVGVGDSVHVISVYRDLRRDGIEQHEAIVRAVASTGTPVLFTTLTTMFGLLSFRFATIDAVGDMGTAGAFGVLVALFQSVVILPLVLSFHKKGSMGATELGKRDFIDRFLGWCTAVAGRRWDAPPSVAVNQRRRRLTVSIGFILIGVAVYGGSLVDVWHNPLSWVPDGDPVKIALTTMDENLGGTAQVQLLFTSKSEHGMKDRELLAGIEKLDTHIRRYRTKADKRTPAMDIVGNSISLIDIAKETYRALNAGDDAFYRLPETQARMSQTLELFQFSGPKQLRRIATTDLKSAQMTVGLRWLEATSYGPFTEYVREGVDKYIGDKADVRMTGAAFTLFTTVSSLIENLLRSFAVAFGVITLIMIILLRDLRLGLIAMVPNLMPIVMILGLMGFANIPIDMANLMIASIALGLAVDDTIHYLHRWKVVYDRHGDGERAISHAIQHSGRAIVGTTLILACGFFVFLGGSLVSLQRFGFLIGMSVIFALFIDLIFGTALLRTLYDRKTSSFASDPTTSGASHDASSDESSAPAASPVAR